MSGVLQNRSSIAGGMALSRALAFWRGLRRKLSAIGAALIIAAQVFSIAYIAHETDHDCQGHDCPICVVLQQCVSNFQLLGSGTVSEPPSVTECAAAFAQVEKPTQFRPVSPTLVSLKVRLNE